MCYASSRRLPFSDISLQTGPATASRSPVDMRDLGDVLAHEKLDVACMRVRTTLTSQIEGDPPARIDDWTSRAPDIKFGL